MWDFSSSFVTFDNFLYLFDGSWGVVLLGAGVT